VKAAPPIAVITSEYDDFYANCPANLAWTLLPGLALERPGVLSPELVGIGPG
jgi:hypothetical protein